MSLIFISDELKVLLDDNIYLIKDKYLTQKLFIDSAVRSKLGRMGVEIGEEEIIPHIEKLAQTKAQHVDQRRLKEVKNQHKRRIAEAKRRLENIE
jgi:hypothetical protein